MWSDFTSGTEDSHEFAVYHVHGVGLEFQARSRLLLHQSPLYPLSEVFGLPDVEVGLQRTFSMILRIPYLFLIQSPFPFKRPTEPSILRFSPSNAMS